MTKDETLAAAQVMIAHANGATVRRQYRGTKDWIPCLCPIWNWREYTYEVVPAPIECWAVVTGGDVVVANYVFEHLARNHAAASGYRVVHMREVV